MPGAIDAMAIATTPEILPHMNLPALDDYADGSGGNPNGGGIPEDEMVRQMDAAGVQAAIVAASRTEAGPKWRIPIEAIKGMMDRNPGRFYGLIGVNVFHPEDSLRDVVRAIDVCGFKGIHIYPHRMKVPPNSPAYDPFYRMARELDVPVTLQIGNCFQALVADRAMMESVQNHDLAAIKPYRGWYCHPVYLDDVCRRFPEVKIVASHVGWPWTEDLVDLMAEHANLYADTSVYYPSVWEPVLVEYIRGPGATKVMWGTNYPEVLWDKALDELSALGLPADSAERLTRQNALDLYRLPT